jgi:hypothetical protein
MALLTAMAAWSTEREAGWGKVTARLRNTTIVLQYSLRQTAQATQSYSLR